MNAGLPTGSGNGLLKWVLGVGYLAVLTGAGLLFAEAEQPAGKPEGGNQPDCRFEPPYPEAQVRSRICFQRGAQELQVLLVPTEERAEVLRGPYCGGNPGDLEYSGSYRLVSVLDGVQVSILDSPVWAQFNVNRPEYGLRYIKIRAKIQADAIALFQYAGCNNNQVGFYRLDETGKLHPLLFRKKDGSEHQFEYLSNGSEPQWIDGKGFVFCWYDQMIGSGKCNSYWYDGKNLVLTFSR